MFKLILVAVIIFLGDIAATLFLVIVGDLSPLELILH